MDVFNHFATCSGVSNGSREDRHTGDIDFAVALDLDEFAELERRLLADKWIRFANREHNS